MRDPTLTSDRSFNAACVSWRSYLSARLATEMPHSYWTHMLVAGLLVGFAPLAAAQGFPSAFDVSSLADGDGSNGFVLNGPSENDRAVAASAGDINGDGVNDLVVIAPAASAAGQVYVVFGRRNGNFSPQFALGKLATGNGKQGFVLHGVDSTIYRVSTGDFNDDNVDDLAISAPLGERPDSGLWGGAIYVVFGRTTGFPANYELSALAGGDGTEGFVVYGESVGDQAVATATGDINGDGVDDLIVGARFGDPGRRGQAGETYVVFGRPAGTIFPAEFDLATIGPGDGSAGFKLDGISSSDYARGAAAGDLNGDGIDDVIISAPNSNPSQAYVVFGRNTGFRSRFQLSSLAAGDGSTGFVVTGVDYIFSQPENPAVSTGDFNGDGIDDLLIGYLGTSPYGSFVIFGRTSGFPADFDLATLAEGDGSTGFVINGVYHRGGAGGNVSTAGDVNNDGIDDMMIGAPYESPGGRTEAGVTYVVFGQDAAAGGFPATFELSWVPDGNGDLGFVLNGENPNDYLGNGGIYGESMFAAGDVNGDGVDDLVIGTENGEPQGFENAGRSYVVYGRSVGSGGGGGDSSNYISVGDFVWRDVDGDGIQDSNESGWPGVAVALLDCSRKVLGVTRTDSEGNYRFSGLGPGRYQVAVTLPTGATFSPKAAGNDTQRNSDVRPDQGKTWCVTIDSLGENSNTLDAGLVPGGSSSLGDYVWNDLNGDGIQDSTEPGLNRVKVKLRNCNGIYQQTTFTGADGRYQFENLLPGYYRVHFITPTGMTNSPRNRGVEGRDSDADSGGLSQCVNLGDNDMRRGVDAGYIS